MATPQAAATAILSEFVTPGTAYGGARPARAFPVYTGFSVQPFVGAVQAAFLAIGTALGAPPTFTISDLEAGLAYAVEQGWLSLGQELNGVQFYVLEQAGFVEAGGTAPTQAASAQQILNVCASISETPNGQRFEANVMAGAFAVTVGGNSFAVEDFMPGYGYALAQGWVRPCGQSLFDPVFTLTAAGAAQAA